MQVGLPPLDVATPETMRAVSAAAAVVMPMHRMLYGLCESIGVNFILGGRPVSHADVLGPAAFLPAVAWMSQDAGKRLLDADFGCLLRMPSENEPTLLGVRCVVPPVTGHIADVTRALFCAHFAVEIFGLRRGALIEVMPLQEVLKEIFTSHSADLQKGEMAWPQMSPTI